VDASLNRHRRAGVSPSRPTARERAGTGDGRPSRFLVAQKRLCALSVGGRRDYKAHV